MTDPNALEALPEPAAVLLSRAVQNAGDVNRLTHGIVLDRDDKNGWAVETLPHGGGIDSKPVVAWARRLEAALPRLPLRSIQIYLDAPVGGGNRGTDQQRAIGDGDEARLRAAFRHLETATLERVFGDNLADPQESVRVLIGLPLSLRGTPSVTNLSAMARRNTPFTLPARQVWLQAAESWLRGVSELHMIAEFPLETGHRRADFARAYAPFRLRVVEGGRGSSNAA